MNWAIAGYLLIAAAFAWGFWDEDDELTLSNVCGYGRAAGPIRNALMAEDGKANLVIAFAGGNGTKNMTHVAKAAGIEVREVK